MRQFWVAHEMQNPDLVTWYLEKNKNTTSTLLLSVFFLIILENGLHEQIALKLGDLTVAR